MKREVDDASARLGGGAEQAGAGALATAALREAARLVAGLTPEQLVELAEGRARFVYEPTAPASAPAPRRPPADAADPDAVGAAARAIRELRTPREVAEHLDRHRYPVPVLKRIARALGPTVSTAARTRAGLERDIVEGTAGYRTRSAAMSGGAWS